MSRQSFTIGRIWGIPVGVDFSWFLIMALVTWSLATSYFPTGYKGWTVATYWTVGVVTAILFFGSVFLHELAHSLVARRFRLPVRRITLYIFGGVSELTSEPPSAWAEFWISISGPLTNLLLAGLFALAVPAASGLPAVEALLKYLAYLNLILGLFNLIPGYPLDGGSVLMSIVWGISHKKNWGIFAAATIGSIVAYALILLGTLQLFNGSLMSGLWTAFIGWFMLNASGGAVRQERLKEMLSDHRVAEAMSKNYVVIYPDTTLQCLVDDHILGSSRRSFIVKQGDALVGMLTMHALQTVPKSEWPVRTVEQVMIPLSKLITVQPSTDLYAAIQEMDQDGVNQLPVIEAGQIQGVLTREGIISFLRGLHPGGRSLTPAR